MSELWNQVRWAIPMWFVTVATSWWPDNRIALRLRGAMAAPFIGKCGRGFQLGAGVTLLNTYNLEIGDNVYIARGTWFNAMGRLILEDEVVIAPYVAISTLQHVFANGSVRFGGSIARPVTIGRGTWIAAHGTVKCGVVIGKGNVVAANSCVVSDTPDFVVVGGVPATVIKENKDGVAEFVSRSDLLASSGESHS